MESIKRILLVEDDQNDVELTLSALEEYNLVNEVIVCNDGEAALDFLYKKNICRPSIGQSGCSAFGS